MTDVRIKRILRVNHAGEYGAIRIYNAQIAVTRRLHPQLAGQLTKMRDDEIRHLDLFARAMPARGTRPCYTLWVWSWGGYLLGLITTLCGRNLIMVCTEAVEDAVHHHLNGQIAFLEGRDETLRAEIEAIKVEELDHLHQAQAKVVHTPITRAIGRVIGAATHVMVALSTQGDSLRMRADMAA